MRYVTGCVNCVERKAGFVFETPKASIRNNFAYQKQGCDKKLPAMRKSGKRKIRTREKDSASLKIILSVGAFDHDRDIVLDPLKHKTR